MFVKKIVLFLILLSTLVISSFAGYFTGLRYADKTIKDDVSVSSGEVGVSAETAKLPVNDLISTNTQIVKKHKYIKGVEFIKEYTEIPGSEVLGMNMESAEKYYKDKGYKLIEFTPDKVILSKSIDSWPPESYIVKADNNVMTIYKSDSSGALSKLQDTGITLDVLPIQDKEEVLKGKVYETIEEVEALIEEYSS